MPRIAAITSQQRTKEELANSAVQEDGSDDEDYVVEEEAGVSGGSSSNPRASKKRKAGVDSFCKRGARGGISLSDDEEDERVRTIDPSEDEDGKAESETRRDDEDLGFSESSTVRKEGKGKSFQSMGDIISWMNRPNKNKKAKAKRGRKMDCALRDLLNDDNEPKKNSAEHMARNTAAAKAALTLTGKMTVMKEVNFAGETISVERSVNKSSKEAIEARELENSKDSGSKTALDQIVDELKNPKKGITVMEKSSYDWEKFKEDEGIAEEVETTAKQNSFVEKQEFLNRVDQRTYDVELAEKNRLRAMIAAREARLAKKK